MFNGRKPHEYPHNYIGISEHREVARQAVRESIVLLKNNNNVLPIKANKHILVIGEAANKILPRSLPNDAIGAQTNI